ncbi:hypothetical protein CEE37_11820 [candidate division LCP-89 bacterium B3_LCP]|uniref:AMP-dependent synthetase n=1 Tax=candidate division LCP-89 bacterium B3_LCP TaxID=2012998 RepID=A0A532UW02_UNCL8|nr:MAG: hypothetical protein CEE37_11820 [candidate division LCP-89 bacterium B3_LCP]
MTIWDTLTEALEGAPDSIAVVDGAVRLTYGEVHRRISSLGNFLRSQGIGQGDRISILDVNSVHFYEAYYTAAGLGTILNPLNYRLSVKELVYILNDAGSRWLLASPCFKTEVESILKSINNLRGTLWLGEKPDVMDGDQFSYNEALQCAADFLPASVQNDAIAHLYYTSGTTGKPKGVILTHKNICCHAQGTIDELQLSSDDVWGHIAPMFHLADAWATFAITAVGGRHVMLPAFDAESALKLIENERITISNLIPTMLNLMVKNPDVHTTDLSSLRMILSGGAPIAIDVVRRTIEAFRCEYVQTYGMTETSPYLTLSLLKEHLKALPEEEQISYRARTGRPFKTVDLKVVREDDPEEVVRNDREVGEIWVKGDTITPGYWNRPDETKEVFSDGWLRTGDLAVIDSEGYLNIVDRKKDMIISGGENIYSIEVESLLYEHPDVIEAAVVGIPDETWGEIVGAFVVLKIESKTSGKELIRFCKDNLSSFKVPKRVILLQELPKTGSGKIYKKGLRDIFCGEVDS